MPGQASITAKFPISTLVSIFMLPIRGVLWWTVGAQLWAITSVVSWISAFLSFPLRILTAAYREKQVSPGMLSVKYHDCLSLQATLHV